MMFLPVLNVYRNTEFTLNSLKTLKFTCIATQLQQSQTK